MLWQLAEVHLFFHFCSCKWDQMGPRVSADPHTDTVQTSISSSVSDAISFATFPTSVKCLLKQQPMTEPWHHKLTIQSDATCSQLRPLHPLHEGLAKFWWSHRRYFVKRLRTISRTDLRQWQELYSSLASITRHGTACNMDESWQVRIYIQNTSKSHFYCFLKDILTLKSSCSLKSPTHAVVWWPEGERW